MQLDAIGEHHPRPLIQRAFIHTGFGRKAERAAIHGYFRDGNSPTPYFVIEDSFWKFFKQKMLRLGQEHHDRQKESYDPLEGMLYSDGQFEELSQLSCELFDIARHVWEEEVSAIRIMGYDQIYLEGNDSHYPVNDIVRKEGLDLVNLDQDNTYHDQLQERLHLGKDCIGGEGYTLQQHREDLWVKEKIQKSNERCLLIAGEDHIDGTFGLDKRLEEEGIQLRTIRSFGNYSARISDIDMRMKCIMIEASLNSREHHKKIYS